MNISLTDHYDKMLKYCVESGRYNNVSEVIREALRIWEKQHAYDTWLLQEARKGYEDVIAGNTTPIENEAEFLKLARD